MISQAKARLTRLLPKSQFARSVGVLVGGTASAQLLLILAAPLLTRLYTPDDFGLLAVYAGLLSIIAVIASLRYELAIPLPKSDQEAAHVVALSLLIVAAMTIVCGVIVFIYGELIAAQLGVPRLAYYFWLLPLGVFLTGNYQVFNYWAIRTKRFSAVAGTRMRQAIVAVAIQIIGFKAGGVALLLGHAGGQGMGAFRLGKQALAEPEHRRVSWAGIKQAASAHRRFPLFSMIAALANSGGKQLLPIMLAVLFGSAAAGLFFLAQRIVFLPSGMLSGAIGQVYLSGAAEARRNGDLGRLTEETHDKLTRIAMPVALLLLIVSPDLFTYIFGSIWSEAGEYARYMVPWLYMQFCTSALTVFLVTGHQHYGLVMQLVLLTAQVLALVLGKYIGTVLGAVQLFSIVSAIVYLFFLWLKLIVSGASVLTAFRSHGKAFLNSLLPSAPLVLAVSLASSRMQFLGFVAITLLLYVRMYYRSYHLGT